MQIYSWDHAYSTWQVPDDIEVIDVGRGEGLPKDVTFFVHESVAFNYALRTGFDAETEEIFEGGYRAVLVLPQRLYEAYSDEELVLVVRLFNELAYNTDMFTKVVIDNDWDEIGSLVACPRMLIRQGRILSVANEITGLYFPTNAQEQALQRRLSAADLEPLEVMGALEEYYLTDVGWSKDAFSAFCRHHQECSICSEFFIQYLRDLGV